MKQTEMDLSGSALRDEGIERAVNHAERVEEGWSDKAYRFCVWFARCHETFSGEQVREASKGVIEEPPSLRAWGGVMMSAARRGIIEKIGYIQVNNPLAHKANAALWRSKFYG